MQIRWLLPMKRFWGASKTVDESYQWAEIPTDETVTASYNTEHILEKEVEPLLNRDTSENITKTRWSTSIRTKCQRIPQLWHSYCVRKTCWTLLEKNEWPGSNPYLNPRGNSYIIIDQNLYSDPETFTMGSFKRKLKVSWKSICKVTLKLLMHSMPKWLKIVVKINGIIFCC